MIDTNPDTIAPHTQDMAVSKHTGRYKNPQSIEKRLFAMGWTQPGHDIYIWSKDNRRLYISRYKGVVHWKHTVSGVLTAQYDKLSIAVSALECEYEGEKGEKSHTFEGVGG